MKRQDSLPDYTVTKTDDQDQDPGERSFKCREQLSKNHSALNCEDTQTKMMIISEKKKTSRQSNTSKPPTVVSFVTDALVLWVEHSLLQHAEYDDSADPELDPQQIPPVAGTPQEPESPEQHIHDAHDHEELWRTWGGGRHISPMMGDTTHKTKLRV